jgi:hypothetical protein
MAHIPAQGSTSLISERRLPPLRRTLAEETTNGTEISLTSTRWTRAAGPRAVPVWARTPLARMSSVAGPPHRGDLLRGRGRCRVE